MTIYTSKPLPERRPADFYPTPRWAVEEGLNVVDEMFVVQEWLPRSILDVGAGGGIWGEVAHKLWPHAQIAGIEVREDVKPRPDYSMWLTADFFDQVEQLRAMGPFDLIMGNPPFGVVERILDECWGMTTPPVDCRADKLGWMWGGMTAFFLRLAFLEGQKRRDGLYKEHPLSRLGVYSKRVSFQEDGKTNATAHAMFVWENGHPGMGLRFLGK